MPVNLTAPLAHELKPIAGLKLGIAKAEIRKPNRKDMLVMHLAEGSHVAGVFTTNQFCAAPVTVCRQHLSAGKPIRALLVNTGNANAGTGEQGWQDAKQSCQILAQLLDIAPEQVLPFSTGVILEPLPMDRLLAGLPACVADLHEDHWLDAAESIMTTDIVAKAASQQIQIDGVTVTITGIAKGSGMIHPNMATMLSYIATDANISQATLDEMVSDIVNQSFNCITVDGDTSTNDAFILIATRQVAHAEINTCSANYQRLRDAICEIAIQLAKAIVRDGEGATKLMTIQVEAGRDVQECRQIAYAIAGSPLVKTAFFASDPNLGRILAAIGYAGVSDLQVDKLQLYLNETLVAEHGGRASSYSEEQGAAVMQQAEILVRVVLNRGVAKSTIWTCDFSYDYVKINASYRS